jgi:hypothetical protein
MACFLEAFLHGPGLTTEDFESADKQDWLEYGKFDGVDKYTIAIV